MINLSPLLEASLAIQIHVFTAVLGFIIGAFVLLRQKGDSLHKMMGRCFAVLTLIVATSSFFIHSIKMWGLFSWIHLLSIWTIIGVILSVKYVRQGKITAHKANMLYVYIGGFIIAGGFAFLPGRIMYRIVFAN